VHRNLATGWVKPHRTLGKVLEQGWLPIDTFDFLPIPLKATVDDGESTAVKPWSQLAPVTVAVATGH